MRGLVDRWEKHFWLRGVGGGGDMKPVECSNLAHLHIQVRMGGGGGGERDFFFI